MNLLHKIIKRYSISTKCKRFPHTNIDHRSNISNIGIIEIGEYTYGYFDIICWNASDYVRIGKFCSIAPGVKIFGGGEHNKRFISTFPLKHFFADCYIDPNVTTKGPTIIGNDVWIGTNSIVLSGIKVSDGAIIGAGSVASKDIPPYAIAAGNPIQIIGFRFDEETIRKLTSISWWDWPIEKIQDNLDCFYQDTETFINNFY